MTERKDFLNENKLFSIITVCYNAEKEIRETVQSIASQTYTDFEYIVVDGKSTDNTLTIIESFRDLFKKRNIPFNVVSEKDNGIYDAMNKGIDICHGRLVNFMNAGDCFYNNQVLEKVASYCKDNEYDLVYGDTIFKDGEYYKFSQSSNFKRELSFCHQSAFTSSRYLKELHFDDYYSISADNHFYVRMSKNQINTCRVHFPISIFSVDGISTKNMSMVWKQNALMRLNEGIWSKEQYQARMDEIQKIENIEKNGSEESLTTQKSDTKSRIKRIIPSFIMDYRYKYHAYKRRKNDGWRKKCP